MPRARAPPERTQEHRGSQPRYYFKSKRWRQNGGFANYEEVTEYIENLSAAYKKHSQEIQEYQAKLDEARANFEVAIAELRAFKCENDKARSAGCHVFPVADPEDQPEPERSPVADP